MKRLAVMVLAFAVLCSDTCQANDFFKGLVGSWKEVSRNTIREYGQNFTFSDESRVTFRLLKNGTLYSVAKSTSDGQVSKSWLYPRGTLRGTSYTDGVKARAETTGTWRILNGKLLFSQRTKLDGKVVGNSEGEIRRVNRNKYVTRGTASSGSHATATLTRIPN